MSWNRETELTANKYTKEWLENFGYAVGDKILHNGGAYECILAHYSLASTEPETGDNWATYWETSAGYLLQENGSFLLQEDGSKIVIYYGAVS